MVEVKWTEPIVEGSTGSYYNHTSLLQQFYLLLWLESNQYFNR